MGKNKLIVFASISAFMSYMFYNIKSTKTTKSPKNTEVEYFQAIDECDKKFKNGLITEE